MSKISVERTGKFNLDDTLINLMIDVWTEFSVLSFLNALRSFNYNLQVFDNDTYFSVYVENYGLTVLINKSDIKEG